MTSDIGGRKISSQTGHGWTGLGGAFSLFVRLADVIRKTRGWGGSKIRTDIFYCTIYNISPQFTSCMSPKVMKLNGLGGERN